MSSVRAVPETQDMDGDELSAEDAWHTARRVGPWALLADSFTRFRYGDGFSHARAFALQLALATVPLIIAGSGLAGAIGADSVAEVVARTVVASRPVRATSCSPTWWTAGRTHPVPRRPARSPTTRWTGPVRASARLRSPSVWSPRSSP